jgi:hypothetical protein
MQFSQPGARLIAYALAESDQCRDARGGKKQIYALAGGAMRHARRFG